MSNRIDKYNGEIDYEQDKFKGEFPLVEFLIFFVVVTIIVLSLKG